MQSPSRHRACAPRADAPQLASLDVAAEFLDVHPRTVRRMIDSGDHETACEAPA
jgi:hypothetical protein